MLIDTTCEKCRTDAKIDECFLGHSVDCKTCGESFVVRHKPATIMAEPATTPELDALVQALDGPGPA